MKTSLSILREARAKAAENVRYHTANAESWGENLQRCKSRLASVQQDLESVKKQMQTACTNRNGWQVQVNELDTAIARLSSEE
jgi:methylphosphotriester-DNA--protein-cysteine methyltransferase